jgi:16S rRNA (cytosine1402-N4)-methyltransferase
MIAPAPWDLPGGHTPVMLAEVLDALAPREGCVYVDATFGAGGYASAVLEAASCRVLGLDRDPDACRRAEALVARYAGRLTVAHGRFADLPAITAAREIVAIDGIAFDLGVSSTQLDTAERGFSFRFDGPLDMRMDSSGGATAAETVNKLAEDELADLIWRLGDERFARRIARAIVRARTAAPIERTGQLADIVRSVVPRAADGIDPATRTFQALRIYVNDEVNELERGLLAAEAMLVPGGRLVVVAFHSLEDRVVKSFLRHRSSGDPHASRHLPAAARHEPSPTFRLLTRRPLRPSPREVAANPRARSARLRAAERLAAPPADKAHAKRRAA